MGGGSLIDIKEDTHDGDDLSLEGSSGNHIFAYGS
jgi:hypothetical protein